MLSENCIINVTPYLWKKGLCEFLHEIVQLMFTQNLFCKDTQCTVVTTVNLHSQSHSATLKANFALAGLVEHYASRVIKLSINCSCHV